MDTNTLKYENLHQECLKTPFASKDKLIEKTNEFFGYIPEIEKFYHLERDDLLAAYDKITENMFTFYLDCDVMNKRMLYLMNDKNLNPATGEMLALFNECLTTLVESVTWFNEIKSNLSSLIFEYHETRRSIYEVMSQYTNASNDEKSHFDSENEAVKNIVLNLNKELEMSDINHKADVKKFIQTSLVKIRTMATICISIISIIDNHKRDYKKIFNETGFKTDVNLYH